MGKIIVAIPHSHTWFWTQVCVASLMRNPPVAEGFEVGVVVVDNSPWSPAIRGVIELHPYLKLWTIPNIKSNKFHASALDYIVESYDFDYLMALEPDVLALRPTWLQWFVDQMRPTDYAVGHWHHEQFINPSCTLYRGDALRKMMKWCKESAPQDELRWGHEFNKTAPLDNNIPKGHPAVNDMLSWIAGPFAEKRGFPAGTILKEQPSGQEKGPGWYEPGQMLHHWAVNEGYTYTICPTQTTKVPASTGGERPVHTLYGVHFGLGREATYDEMLEMGAETVHLWGGTRALDILKHDVSDPFISAHTPMWLAREARFWNAVVPPDVRARTLELIVQYGWHYRGQGTPDITQRDRDAAEFVRACYREGGVEW